MRKIDLSKENGTLKRHLEKTLMRQHYKKAMIQSFKENFEMIKEAGMSALRQSFLECGKDCRFLTPDEYADLAVETYNEVMKTR